METNTPGSRKVDAIEVLREIQFRYPNTNQKLFALDSFLFSIPCSPHFEYVGA